MALKDWFKSKEDGYKIVYSNEKTGKNYYIVKLRDSYMVGGYESVGKYFKTKQQAIRFAKAYMRKH